MTAPSTIPAATGTELAATGAEVAATGAELAATGAVPQLEGYSLRLEEMATADSTELWRIDFRKISVADRNLFRRTALFHSYAEHNFLILYKGAKA